MQDDPLHMTTLATGALYPVFMGLMLAFLALSVINLIRSARAATSVLQRKQLKLMATATVVAGLVGPIGIVSLILDIQTPRVVLSLLLGANVFMVGYGVARYSALIEGRVIGRDFFYNFAAVLFLAGLYFSVTWFSFAKYDIPVAIVSTLMVLAIVTHGLADGARHFFDLFFYRRESRELREKMRTLVHRAYHPDMLEEFISPALSTLCKLTQATYGVILLFEQDKAALVARHGWRESLPDITPKDLTADDAVVLSRGKLKPPFDNAALLIPLYASEKQIGALILGMPKNSKSFSDSDIENALGAGDRFADAIRDAERESANLTRLIREVETFPSNLAMTEETQTSAVEDALRNLFDYAYLADTPLAETNLVRERLGGEKKTHIERGKAVHAIMVESIEHLRPVSEIPRDPPPREWYPYIILHDAYAKDVKTRDIMSKLYISEGTFNRTRRSAIRSLARALAEMENPG